MRFLKKDFDIWIKNDWNVLIEGEAGVGKTSVVLDAFKRHNLKYLYFSASTMDPWVDFIGVPKEKIDENGKSVLELVRPSHFAYDEVEAIFLDEYNRAPKKVRNAVMELIQFKSINGKKFKKLRFVWTAINPADGIYDTEELDPAQADRFQIRVKMDYEPCKDYFFSKFDVAGESVVDWWKEQHQKVQKVVSPRRLEYALQVFQAKGNVEHVLPTEANVVSFITKAKGIDIKKQLKSYLDEYKRQCLYGGRGVKTKLRTFIKSNQSDVLLHNDILQEYLDILPDIASKELCITIASKMSIDRMFTKLCELKKQKNDYDSKIKNKYNHVMDHMISIVDNSVSNFTKIVNSSPEHGLIKALNVNKEGGIVVTYLPEVEKALSYMQEAIVNIEVSSGEPLSFTFKKNFVSVVNLDRNISKLIFLLNNNKERLILKKQRTFDS